MLSEEGLTRDKLASRSLRQFTHFDSFEIENLGGLAPDGKTNLKIERGKLKN